MADGVPEEERRDEGAREEVGGDQVQQESEREDDMCDMTYYV